MKILLFCPLNPDKDHKGDPTVQLFGRTNQSIFRQDYPQIDFMFRKGDNPFFDNNGRHNICHNYQVARRYVLDNGYDYLITVEADMIIPPDALSRLLAADGDVAYGLYCFKNTSSWSAWTHLDMEGGRSLRKDPDLAKRYWGKVIDVAGVGMGCTLIRRQVLEEIDFRVDDTHPSVHNDWTFAYDLQQAGFRQVCDLGVVCGHISMKPSPRVIWPDPDMPRLYRNDFIDTIPRNPDGSIEIPVTGFGEFTVTPESIGMKAEDFRK